MIVEGLGGHCAKSSKQSTSADLGVRPSVSVDEHAHIPMPMSRVDVLNELHSQAVETMTNAIRKVADLPPQFPPGIFPALAFA